MYLLNQQENELLSSKMRVGKANLFLNFPFFLTLLLIGNQWMDLKNKTMSDFFFY